jgi:hypothetical protein
MQHTLPWGEGREYSFAEFSEKYTLHDSAWVGLFHDVGYEDSVILAFLWDAVWLPNELARSISNTGDWLLLLVKVERVSRVSTSGYADIGGILRGIGGAEFGRAKGANLLTITDHYGGRVEIYFAGKMVFLALDGDERVLPI